jgi:hypothetical protein
MGKTQTNIKHNSEFYSKIKGFGYSETLLYFILKTNTYSVVQKIQNNPSMREQKTTISLQNSLRKYYQQNILSTPHGQNEQNVHEW